MGGTAPSNRTDRPTSSAYLLQQRQENGKEKGNFNWIKYTKNISICIVNINITNEMSVLQGEQLLSIAQQPPCGSPSAGAGWLEA